MTLKTTRGLWGGGDGSLWNPTVASLSVSGVGSSASSSAASTEDACCYCTRNVSCVRVSAKAWGNPPRCYTALSVSIRVTHACTYIDRDTTTRTHTHTQKPRRCFFDVLNLTGVFFFFTYNPVKQAETLQLQFVLVWGDKEIQFWQWASWNTFHRENYYR